MQSFITGLFRQDKLVLDKTILTVDAIPVPYGIKWIEESINIDGLFRNSLIYFVVIEPVEEFDTPTVERK